MPESETGVLRLHGHDFVAGAAEYAADLKLPGMLFAVVVRSPHPSAIIRSIDLERARQSAGVVAAVTGLDLAKTVGPIPLRYAPSRLPAPITVRCLAVDRVLYTGQAVAAVVAETRAEAEAAARLVLIDYELLPAVTNAEAALADGAPLLYPEWGTNVMARDHIRVGDVESAFSEADVVVKGELAFSPATSAPIEPRAYLADWDTKRQRLTLHGSFQMPHPTRWCVAQALKLRESQVRVIAPNVGGTFGLKMAGHPEEVLVAGLSQLIGRPVAFHETREECFLANGREQRHQFEIAARVDGTVLAFRDTMVADVGAAGPGTGWIMALVTAAAMPTVYNVSNCEINCTIVATNKTSWQGIRGYGKEVANLVMERALDLLAAEIGVDPVEIRRRNLLQPDQLPRRLPSGLVIDSGDYPAALDQLLTFFGYDEWRARQGREAAEGRRIGIGLTFELTPEGASFPGSLPSGYETSTVRVEPSGEVQVATSVTSPGNGNETGIAQLVAGTLGLSPDSIVVIQGDTDVTPFGLGNASSRGLMFGGAAAALAARDIRSKMAQCAADILGAVPDDIHFETGLLWSTKAPDRRLTFAEVALTIYTLPFSTARNVELPLQSTHTYMPQNVRHVPDEHGRTTSYPSFPYSVHAVALEVEETGKIRLLDYALVHDCGVIVNGRLVEGQVKGAVVMGIGAALWEQLVWANGAVATQRFKNYLLPRAPDLPVLRIGHRVTPSPFHPLGMKGAGESGFGGAMACVTSAIADALGKNGRHLTHIPSTPERVLALMTGDAA